jgi:hypothetical protein
MFRSDFGAFTKPSGVLQSRPSSMGALPSMGVVSMRRPAWAAISCPTGTRAAGPLWAVREGSIPVLGWSMATRDGAPRVVVSALGARSRSMCRRMCLRLSPATGGGSARTPPPVAPTTRWRGGGTRNHSRGPAPARHAPQVRAETTSGDGDCPPRPHTNARDSSDGIGRGAAQPVERYRPTAGRTSCSDPRSLGLPTLSSLPAPHRSPRRTERPCPLPTRHGSLLRPRPEDEETVDAAGLTASKRTLPDHLRLCINTRHTAP